MAGGLVAAVEAGIIALAGIGNLAVARRARREEGTAVGPFVLMLVGIGVVVIAAAVVRLSVAPTSDIWSVAMAAFGATCPFLWGLFALAYAGHPEYAQGWRAGALSAFPLLLVGIAAANALGVGTVTRFEEGATTGLVGTAMTLGWSLGAIGTVGMAVAGLILLVAAARSSKRFDSGLAVVVLAVGVIPWQIVFIGDTVAGARGVPAVEPLILALAGFVAAVTGWLAVERYDLFEAIPAATTVGPDIAVEMMDDAMLVVDRNDEVASANPAARQTFRGENGDVVDEPLSAVIDADLAACQHRPTLSVDTPRGRRQYEPSVSAIDRDGQVIGHTVVFRDVTEQRTRRQRLAVLNRVLRHNLRNDLTAIAGYSELIADGRRDPAYVAEQITDTAEGLAATGEKAREVERLMNEPRTTDNGVELAAVVETVADQFRETHPGTAIETDVPEGPALALNESILDAVLAQLVENAIEHHDDTDPSVEITASVDPDHSYPLAVSVADDGSGIPEQERAAITAGEESPLQHGSGLGLWIVNWGVSRLGGAVEFATNDPRGSVVTVRLPERPTSDGPDSAAAEESVETTAVVE